MANNQFIHVNGPAVIWARKPGGAAIVGNLEQVGVTLDGCDIEITSYDKEVHSDAGGPRVPIDLLEMGMDANVRFRLSVYDQTLLSKYFRTLSDESAEGNLPSIGKPIGQTGKAIGLVIASAYDEPWRFYCCRVRARRTKVSSEETVYDCQAYAWALVGSQNAGNGVPLYDHVFG